MKIFLDFDDVLFNTASFKEELIKIFLKNKVSRKNFLASYKDYPVVTKSGLKKYNPFKQIKILKNNLKIDETKIKKDLKNFLTKLSKFVFQDVKTFLSSYHQKDIFIISYGKTNFQQNKIKNCGLKKFCGKIIVTDKLKSDEIKKILENKKELFIFIDDRISQINAVKKNFPQAVTFFMKRSSGRFNDKKTKYADYEVKNLTEVKKIIDKL